MAVGLEPNRTEPNQKLHQSNGFVAKKHLGGFAVYSFYIGMYKETEYIHI